jgi:amino acid transporter
VADLVPHQLDLPSINLFATLTFAFAGLELAPTLGGEITDPAATLRRGVLVSGGAIVAIYVLCTMAILVALPHETVSITNGMPQAVAALTDRLGAPVLAPLAAVIAIMLVVSNIGGVGAWLTGSARLPFAAGVDQALPAAFARVHPKWQTPHVALLFQGGLATILVVVSLAGATAKSAYSALVQTTIILFFIPYLYIFAAYLRLRRVRTWGTAMTGWLGFAAVLFSIVLGFVTPADEPHPGWYRFKVVGGVVLFMAIGWWLARRGVRGRTASRVPAG